MAQAILADTKLRMVFEVGMEENGTPILKSKTFSNIKRTATPEQLHQAAQAIANLCSHPLQAVQRMDSSEIIG